MTVQCTTISKSLNPRNIDKSASDIRVRIRFPFESSFCISIVIISAAGIVQYCSGNTAPRSAKILNTLVPTCSS